MLRRTRLGLLDARRLTDAAAPGPEAMARAMAPELGWDDAEVAAQIDTWHRIAGVEGLVPGAKEAGMRLMGIVNATPDSFSDPQGPKDPAELVERGLRLVGDGAAIVDVGGESGRTDREAVSEDEEAARVVPVIEGLVAEGVTVSVDTWRAGPGRAPRSRPARRWSTT